MFNVYSLKFKGAEDAALPPSLYTLHTNYLLNSQCLFEYGLYFA